MPFCPDVLASFYFNINVELLIIFTDRGLLPGTFFFMVDALVERARHTRSA